MPPTKTWKHVERRVAEKLGGARVGNSGRNTEDVAHPVFSIEVKHRKNMPQIVEESMAQCRRNKQEGKVPLVVLHSAGSTRYYAVIDVDDLAQLLGARDEP